MGKYQRDKGARWERAVAIDLRKALGDAKRGLQSRGGASEEPDVRAGGIVVAECKVGKKPPIRKALETSVTNCAPGEIPIAVIKEDRKVPFAVVRWCDFLEILSVWYHNREN